MNPMNPMSQKYVDLCKEANISADECLTRFDSNVERLLSEGADNDKQENVMQTLDVLSSWLEDALAQGKSMEDLTPRAQKLAKCAFDKGCTQEEVKELLTMHPKG